MLHMQRSSREIRAPESESELNQKIILNMFGYILLNKKTAARGRPIIVEWRETRHSAGSLSFGRPVTAVALFLSKEGTVPSITFKDEVTSYPLDIFTGGTLARGTVRVDGRWHVVTYRQCISKMMSFVRGDDISRFLRTNILRLRYPGGGTCWWKKSVPKISWIQLSDLRRDFSSRYPRAHYTGRIRDRSPIALLVRCCMSVESEKGRKSKEIKQSCERCVQVDASVSAVVLERPRAVRQESPFVTKPLPLFPQTARHSCEISGRRRLTAPGRSSSARAGANRTPRLYHVGLSYRQLAFALGSARLDIE
ncbi:hypothetical protein EVAR_76908_1 [Eumeta japonica]|uniref:Uncharacterized protein n=1 Tax=Eumeta variegata TaxID=151549 RepID=A0A4C1SEX2_EUMVA|nr:hypothetical protein EVAR_76908_1 [Eumeta japonica]